MKPHGDAMIYLLRWSRYWLILPFALLILVWQSGFAERLRVQIDASDLPRKLLRAEVRIPIDRGLVHEGQLKLWFPKWVPGSHGPGGPIQNVAGLFITDQNGDSLAWKRTAGEVYQVGVSIPDTATELVLKMRYITDQASTNSVGHDSFGSALLGFISPGTVLMYPDGWNIDQVRVDAQVTLPADWVASTALKTAGNASGDVVEFQPVTLRTLVDSPIMCGRYRKIYELVEANDDTPPHRLHIFSEAKSVLTLPETMLDRMRRMVSEASLLFGSHPFAEFDVLLATTDVLGRNGLEHSASTFNVLGQRSFQEPDKLKGWDRLLVPHEYIHAWCGKYRRPAGMTTSDFHTDKSTELLWVYEGLTQYLGELVEARAGLMTPDEFRHRLTIEVRAAMLQQGRDWRTLADTGACSHVLRAGSSYWPRLRRSQDYYMEGMLFWLEADAIIRQQSNGTRSLDDFCHRFFAHDDKSAHPFAFDRDDVVTALERTQSYDWDGLIRRRIETPTPTFDASFVQQLGYVIQYSNKKPKIPSNTFRYVGGVDALDSLGSVFASDGTIRDLLLESPLDQAGLGPGMKVIGVNGHQFSENRMRDAIANSVTAGSIELMIVSGDSFENITVEYAGGPRFMVLERSDEEDVLAEILKPRK